MYAIPYRFSVSDLDYSNRAIVLIIIGTRVDIPGFAPYEIVNVNVTVRFGEVPQAARHLASGTFDSQLFACRGFH